MSAAVGARRTVVSLPFSAACCSSTVGLPSTVSTEVGWYCSAEVSQGGSSSLRSSVIGTYFCASSSAADSGAGAAACAADVSASSSSAGRRTSRRRGRFTRQTYLPGRRPGSGSRSLFLLRSGDGVGRRLFLGDVAFFDFVPGHEFQRDHEGDGERDRHPVED